MKNDTLIIFLGVTKKQESFWPSYYAHTPGRPHDIMIAYIDRSVIPEVHNDYGTIVYENKIINGKDIPHRAFGAYRYFFNKYKDTYKYFAFVSDDVIIRSDNWLQACIEPLERHPRLGWVGTQIFAERYCGRSFPDHLRAPIWFAKSEALQKVDWRFNGDHDGEVSTANQFMRAGFFGVQIGFKFDIAYDSLENGGLGVGDGITSCFEKKFFPEKNLVGSYSQEEIKAFEKKIWDAIKNKKIEEWWAESPHPHIQKKNFITELQGLSGQVYVPSLYLARKYANVLENDEYHIQVLAEYAPKDPTLPLHKKERPSFFSLDHLKLIWDTIKNS
jgi:hypothetical protein